MVRGGSCCLALYKTPWCSLVLPRSLTVRFLEDSGHLNTLLW